MSQNVPLTVSTILFGSAALLRDRGWGTRQMEDPDGRLCLVGAITRYIYDRKIEDREVRSNLLDEAINQLTRTIWTLPSGAGMPSTTTWNDRQCASADEAIAMLERAAHVRIG